MSTTLKSDEKGDLHLPAHMVPKSEPLAMYRVEENEGAIIISKESESDSTEPPMWERSPEERVKALREWIAELPAGPGLSDYAVSRDSIYD